MCSVVFVIYICLSPKLRNVQCCAVTFLFKAQFCEDLGPYLINPIEANLGEAKLVLSDF